MNCSWHAQMPHGAAPLRVVRHFFCAKALAARMQMNDEELEPADFPIVGIELKLP